MCVFSDCNYILFGNHLEHRHNKVISFVLYVVAYKSVKPMIIFLASCDLASRPNPRLSAVASAVKAAHNPFADGKGTFVGSASDFEV